MFSFFFFCGNQSLISRYSLMIFFVVKLQYLSLGFMRISLIFFNGLVGVLSRFVVYFCFLTSNVDSFWWYCSLVKLIIKNHDQALIHVYSWQEKWEQQMRNTCFAWNFAYPKDDQSLIDNGIHFNQWHVLFIREDIISCELVFFLLKIGRQVGILK